MQLSFVVLAAALFATAHGLATPAHTIRSAHRHANIAKARSPAPESSAPTEFFSRRGLKKRCKARVPQGGLPAVSSGVGNAADDPADGGIGIGVGVTVGLPSPPPPPTEPAPEPPKPTTPKPEPTTSKPKPTKSSEPAPQPTSGGGGGGDGGSHKGQATYYATGLTACGFNNNDSEMIVAVSKLLFDTYPNYNGANPNNNPICGKKAKVNYKGKSLVVTITDRCEACAYNDLDFTPSGFQAIIGPLGLGRVDGISWDFI